MPKFLKKYFRDVDFEKMDREKYPGFVILRIMEYGDRNSIKWMMKNFPRDRIIEFFEKTRELTLKSAVFWALMLGVKREGVRGIGYRMTSSVKRKTCEAYLVVRISQTLHEIRTTNDGF